MVNFNLEGLENLENLDKLGDFNNETIREIFASIGPIAVFFAILFAIMVVLLWVFGSIGLMEQAKKRNIQNAWLAFLPVGRSYIIGKLGFEEYDKENKNATNFVWITLALGAVSFLLGDSKGDLGRLIGYGKLFFESWAFYNMFKALKPKNAIVYTVFTVLSSTLLGGIFLYLMKPEPVSDATIVSETKDEDKTSKKSTTNKSNYCPNCGAKITKDIKFCPECGTKVNEK